MNKKQKADRKHENSQLGRVVLGRVDDPDLAAASFEMDVAADRRWFAAHPGETERLRQPSLLERAAFGLADGAEVIVKRLKSGVQMRFFRRPPRLSALPTPKRT